MLIFFIIVLLLREYFVIIGFREGKYFCTPLIILIVIITAITSLPESNYSFLIPIIMGLSFSLVGDCILMLEEVNYFIHGLIYFLTAHIFYIYAFALNYSFRFWNILLFGILGLFVYKFYNFLKKKIGKEDYSVLAYMIIIILMLFFATCQFNHGVTAKSKLLFWGALLFTLSDIILAINEFVVKIPNSSVLTWALYGPAQFMIAYSCYY